MRDKTLLRQLQALPLDAKVLMSQQRIREWYNYWNGDVVISFSGGKDSTVLTHLVHDMYPDVPLVFANTGLEYPEIQAFAREMGAEFVRPKMSFSEVISKYGYPIIGKEVAEAIHFARRIVKNAETVETLERERESTRTTTNRKRTEMSGRRENELIRKLSAEPDGEGSTSQATLRLRALQGTEGNHRNKKTTPPHKSYQANPQSKEMAHGERLTGSSGEEKQSPG